VTSLIVVLATAAQTIDTTATGDNILSCKTAQNRRKTICKRISTALQTQNFLLMLCFELPALDAHAIRNWLLCCHLVRRDDQGVLRRRVCYEREILLCDPL